MTWTLNNLALIVSLTADHLQQSLIAIVAGFALSLPLGWAAWRVRWLRSTILTTTGVLYTIPSLALLLILPVAIGYPATSEVNLIVALTIYAIAIMVRAVVEGLDSVDASAREAATAIGYGSTRRFWTVDLPLAGPGHSRRRARRCREHDFAGYGWHSGWRHQSRLSVYRRSAAANHRRGSRRHRRGRCHRGRDRLDFAVRRPPGDAVDACFARSNPQTDLDDANPASLANFANASAYASEIGGASMNLVSDAMAWLFAPAQWQGAGALSLLLFQQLYLTAIPIAIAALIAIPAGWAIGHTGHGREIAVAISGAARASSLVRAADSARSSAGRAAQTCRRRHHLCASCDSVIAGRRLYRVRGG
jgi:ABC-type proline/glycine betaine transport system permease subunit